MKKKLLFLLGGAVLNGLFSLSVMAEISWTDKTSLITNPSFETGDAISDLKNCGWATDRVTGWTISPSSSSNAQVGVGNSSSTIQGIGDTFTPSDGENYFYTRNNWNANTDYSFSQVITREGDNLKAGLYKLTCKAATYSSNAAFNTLTLGLQEGTGASVAHDGIVLNIWNTWGVIIYKRADDTNLTIEVKFKPGYDGSGKHYALLMDDFHLEYISEEDAFTASSTSTIDFSDIINNAGIYNHSTKGTMPRGWTATKHTTGNGNYTEGERGDTRFEGWNGGALDIDYNQTITNLPAGIYTVTSLAHERAEEGKTFIYAYTEGQEKATGLVNSNTENDITTSPLKVSNGTMKIGIESTATDWVTADNFRISFLGFDVEAVKDDYETAFSNATTARDALDNVNIIGQERTTLEGVITTYTTTTMQSYNWYVGAKEALENATTTFTSVRGIYDALVAEIAKAQALGIDATTAEGYAATSSSTAASALTSTQNLKVKEYEYVTTTYQHGVDLGAWNTEGYTSDNSGQHWDGTNTSKYKEQENSWGNPLKGYAAPSWEIKFYQSIELPAGNYVFKVAGRKASGIHTTMSLNVTKTIDDSLLGSISDFPEGDTGLGINKNGATDFTTGEGHEYANDGNGRGWEWRYVKFTLSEKTDVKIAVNAVADDYSQWISFSNYTVQTDNEANISLIAYNIALATAQTTIADGTYSNVTGIEKTNLQDAIAADGTLDKTIKDDIEAATTALNDAVSTFTAAKDSYDAFVEAKAVMYEDNLPYASATKFAAIATAQAAVDAASAIDADTKTTAIISAYRKYVESNALAEGVTGATVIPVTDANMDVTYDGTAHTFGAWEVFGQTNGNIQLLSGESFTDGDGNANYKYADIWKSDNNAGIKQSVHLPSGKYLLTVTARAATTAGASFKVFAGEKTSDIPRVGNSGGTFDRGWNDASVEFVVGEESDVEIGVQSGNGKDLWWSATRFRLVKIAELDQITITVSSAGYATFYSDFDVTIPAGVKAFYAEDNDGLVMHEVTGGKIMGGVGVVLEATAGDYTFIQTTGAAVTEYTALKGVLAETNQADLDGSYQYVLGLDDANNPQFFELSSTGKLGANKAYYATDTQKSALGLRWGDATGIAPVKSVENTVYFDLMGRPVSQPERGIYIMNGKKVLVK